MFVWDNVFAIVERWFGNGHVGCIVGKTKISMEDMKTIMGVSILLNSMVDFNVFCMHFLVIPLLLCNCAFKNIQKNWVFVFSLFEKGCGPCKY
jgi:hypothetical protein